MKMMLNVLLFLWITAFSAAAGGHNRYTDPFPASVSGLL